MWQVINRRLGRSKGRDSKAAPLLNLSTIADAEISNPPWVKFQSAGWVNFPSAPTLSGEVLASCKPRHRHQEFLAFLREIDKSVPLDLDIHCIVDNYATHNHPKVKAWLTARSRWHMHFIPTYSSWLNQVERFFALITDKAIRRGSFTSVKQLVQRIDHFVTSYNSNCRPFRWTATADEILEKLHRLCSRITGTEH